MSHELYIKKPLRRLTWLMAIIIYCGVYTGALVRHADASLAYGGWPLPFHDLVPHSEQDWVQLTHRIMAFIVFTIIMITYIHAVKNYPNNPYCSLWLYSCIYTCYITSYHRCIIYYDKC